MNLIKTCAVLALFIFPYLSAEAERPKTKNQSSYLAVDIDLAHWEFSNPSDVEYASIGIIHRKDEDPLVMYDIRSKKAYLEDARKRLAGLKGT